MDLVANMETIIVRHYNYITCSAVSRIEDIPDCAMQLYYHCDYKSLAIPVAMLELKQSKKPVAVLMQQYCLTRRQVEYWAKIYAIPLPTVS